jgi:hypothetical protein
MKPLAPAIASIRELASATGPPAARSAWNAEGSNLPSWSSKAFAISAKGLAVCTRTWVVMDVEVVAVSGVGEGEAILFSP